MAEIIDSLIVTLGLDPSGFDKARKRAVSDWLKARDDFKKGGKDIEDSNKRTADSFDRVTKSALGLFAVLIGARSFKDFAVNVTQTDAALGRMSTNLGISAQNLARWQGAAVRVGGTAEGAADAVKTANDQLLGLRNNGTPLPTALARLFADTGVTPNLNGSTEQYLESIARAASIESQKRGSQQASYLLTQAGLGGLNNLMIAGNVPGRLAQVPTPTNQAISNAQDLLSRWNGMQQSLFTNGGNVLMDLEPVLRPFLDDITKFGDWMGQNEPVFRTMGQILGDVVSDFGQLRAALEIWIGILAGSKILGVAGAAGRVLGLGAAAGAAEAAGGPSVWMLTGAALLGVDAYNNTVKPTGIDDNRALAPLFGNAWSQEAYIRQKALSLGMDPNTAVTVARHEGLGGRYAGDQGSSFGDFQLHMGGLAPGVLSGNGLGDEFKKATGLDPRRPETWKAQIDFALQWAKTHGWGAWSGAKAAGITGFMGVNGSIGPGGGGTNIGQINISVPGGDATAIANSIGPAIQRAKIAQPANSGPM